MRKIGLIILVLLLTACSTRTIDFDQTFKQALTRIDDMRLAGSNNFNKGLFSYYLPQDIGVLESNKISSVLVSDGNTIFMSVNVSSVMSEKERTLTLDENDFELIDTFELQGRKENKAGRIYIEHLSKENYLLYVFIDDVFFVSATHQNELSAVLEKILLVGRSLEVDKSAIVAEFSNKETFSFEKEVIELFSDSIPEEGMIKDIIIEEAGD